jgi:hypothetical protein
MPRHRRDRRSSHRGPSRRPHLGVERLEGRIVYAASIGFDPASRVLSINGSEGNDTVEVRQQSRNLVASLNSASGRLSRTMSSATVSQIVFTGNAGSDMLVGGRGRDREVDGEDWFADGDNDRDGYDNDWSPLDRKYD